VLLLSVYRLFFQCLIDPVALFLNGPVKEQRVLMEHVLPRLDLAKRTHQLARVLVKKIRKWISRASNSS
jgi:hypothetical protein